MNVTTANFYDELANVEESIDKADFLAIDTEFSGLLDGKGVTPYDTPAVYYATLLNKSADFLLMQYGLSCFYWDEEKKMYKNDTYNFFIFPKAQVIFKCQGLSLKFLGSSGFDFNKWINEGIPYISEEVENKMSGQLKRRKKSNSTANDFLIPIPDDSKEQIDSILKKVATFLAASEPAEFEIDRCNAFIRKLIFQEIARCFPGEAFVESKVLNNSARVLVISRCKSESEIRAKEDERREQEWDELEECVGFTRVIQKISQSGKLMVGHNMVLDLLHTIKDFLQPLPDDYSEFKIVAHQKFPRLLDTKYMSSLPTFKKMMNSSALEDLWNTLSEPPFSKPVSDCDAGRGYCSLVKKHHEAGYDAYITGLCFIAMYMHLANKQLLEERIDLESPLIAKLYNKVFLAKTAHTDSPFMDLTGDEPSPKRDHVFHLTFPSAWSKTEIVGLFSPFGHVSIAFLDDTSAFVSLGRVPDTSVLSTIKTMSSDTCRILTYQEYEKKQSNTNQWSASELLRGALKMAHNKLNELVQNW